MTGYFSGLPRRFAPRNDVCGNGMTKISAYARLMRLHQPVGIWLVFWPCALALYVAGLSASAQADGLLMLAAVLFLGAVVTRSAGCIINDMIDREFDRQVARTKSSPLASGEVAMAEAAVLVGMLAAVARYLLTFFTVRVFSLDIRAAIRLVA